MFQVTIWKLISWSTIRMKTEFKCFQSSCKFVPPVHSCDTSEHAHKLRCTMVIFSMACIQDSKIQGYWNSNLEPRPRIHCQRNCKQSSAMILSKSIFSASVFKSGLYFVTFGSCGLHATANAERYGSRMLQDMAQDFEMHKDMVQYMAQGLTT